MTNLFVILLNVSALKSRDITLPTKVHLVKATVFPVVMYRCESWTIKKPEHQTIDAFKLWFWRRLLRVPWTAKRLNQSILKEIDYSLEGLMLKLKLQYLGHLMGRADNWKRPWSWERLKAGGEGDNRGWDVAMPSPNQWTWVCVNSRIWWWTGKPGALWSMGSQGVGHDWEAELNWAECIPYLSQDRHASLAPVHTLTAIVHRWPTSSLQTSLQSTGVCWEHKPTENFSQVQAVTFHMWMNM